MEQAEEGVTKEVSRSVGISQVGGNNKRSEAILRDCHDRKS